MRPALRPTTRRPAPRALSGRRGPAVWCLPPFCLPPLVIRSCLSYPTSQAAVKHVSDRSHAGAAPQRVNRKQVMQGAMDRLDSFTRRHRVLVALAWLVLLLGALPFAARQTENLTSGGYAVPGSGSEAVDRGLADFDNAQRESLAAVIARKPGASDADVRRAVEHVRDATGEVAHVNLSERAASEASARAGRAPITVVPLDVSGAQDDAAN